MPQAQTSMLLQRIERLAEKVTTSPHAQVTWNQDGEQYNADLVLERARNGVEPDRVIAEVSAASRGRQLRTRILLRRLPFSYYTQIVDRWDPMIQLHDDEIVGRMHINSRFNVLDDSQATPQFLGKVTTAAVGFNMRSTGRGLGSDVFREGIETRAERVALSERVRPYEWGLRDVNARVHKLEHDTDIRFYADGSYSWRDHKSGASQYRNEPTEQTVYFVAARGATLHVKGVAAGKFLIYSPHSIVLEGSLTYAHDPRNTPDSADYLGLVCDREIEVAPADVTGPGDVIIHAAIFARHRFVVTDTDQPTSATLRIYGSLAAGSLTASEPRYAMQVEYDSRFERFRPPGFPSTNRFAAEDWDGRWTEVPEQSTCQCPLTSVERRRAARLGRPMTGTSVRPLRARPTTRRGAMLPSKLRLGGDHEALRREHPLPVVHGLCSCCACPCCQATAERLRRSQASSRRHEYRRSHASRWGGRHRRHQGQGVGGHGVHLRHFTRRPACRRTAHRGAGDALRRSR